MTEMKHKIIHISPGPLYQIRYHKYEGLSERYAGDIITSSSRKEILKIKDVCGFRLNCFKKKDGGFFSNILFFFYCIQFSVKKRWVKSSYDFVLTYDPLKTGLFGVVVSKIIGCRLIVEVNGVYTSPAEYLDGARSFSVRIKKILYPLIERFVLSRASGIKLLFDKQIDPFKSVTHDKVIKSFPNLVEMERFLEIPIDLSHKVILFVGFPFKRKGVDILIDSFKQISDKFPDWELKILGWYPDPTELIKYIDGHSKIKYHKPVEHSVMPEQLAQCSILVLPSRSEAMGRIMIEGMAAGKPRIGANVDGIPTVINHGVDGLLFESENVDDLAEKLTLLIENESMRISLGTNGRKRAVGELGKETYFANLFEFYNEVKVAAEITEVG